MCLGQVVFRSSVVVSLCPQFCFMPRHAFILLLLCVVFWINIALGFLLQLASSGSLQQFIFVQWNTDSILNVSKYRWSSYKLSKALHLMLSICSEFQIINVQKNRCKCYQADHFKLWKNYIYVYNFSTGNVAAQQWW